jgi:hypothetical protein
MICKGRHCYFDHCEKNAGPIVFYSVFLFYFKPPRKASGYLLNVPNVLQFSLK